jgi:hypothetical protein
MAIFKKLLLDIIPVVIGILLALILNGIVEDIHSKKYFRQSLKAIEEENAHNIKELDYALSRQKIFTDTLRVYYLSDTMSLFDITQAAQGIYSPDLKLTSWKFLLEDSKHTLIPVEMINQLTEIEKHYNIIDSRSEFVMQMIYQESYFDKQASKMPIHVLLMDVKESENDMLSVLKEFAEYVEKQDF